MADTGEQANPNSPPFRHADTHVPADGPAPAEPPPSAEAAAGPEGLDLWLRKAFLGLGRAVSLYTRLEVEVHGELPDPPALVVANHGFGGIFDLNAFAIAETFRRLGHGADEPAVMLTHQMAWTLGVGPYLEGAGFVRASRESAQSGLAAGSYVFVMPGGDIDASKSWRHRNEVRFAGHTGFARIAIENQVPIIPVVTVGAGESLVCISDGQRLARALRLDRLMRTKALPIAIALPWGLGIGSHAILPYVPLPTKLETAVLDPVKPKAGDDATVLALRVQTAMQTAADRMTTGRIPILGWQLAPVPDPGGNARS